MKFLHFLRECLAFLASSSKIDFGFIFKTFENCDNFPHLEDILCTETHAACSNNGRTCSDQVQTRSGRKQRFVYFGFAHGNAKWVDVVNV